VYLSTCTNHRTHPRQVNLYRRKKKGIVSRKSTGCDAILQGRPSWYPWSGYDEIHDKWDVSNKLQLDLMVVKVQSHIRGFMVRKYFAKIVWSEAQVSKLGVKNAVLDLQTASLGCKNFFFFACVYLFLFFTVWQQLIRSKPVISSVDYSIRSVLEAIETADGK